MLQSTQDAVDAVENLPAAEKKDAIEALREGNPGLFPTTDWPKVTLWALLIVGVLVIAGMCVAGAIPVVHAGEDATALLVIVSAITAGLIGLFSKSPTQS